MVTTVFVLSQLTAKIPAGFAMSADNGDYQVFLPIVQTSGQATPPPVIDGGEGWPMVGANPGRTSWTPEEAVGQMHIEWYRPIEAYISQNTQIIVSEGIMYLSTSRGLYALNAANGDVLWRFDTEMPLGNSPTVDNGVVYVGGYDRKLHVLNAQTGEHLWSFDGALAGYDTNPLVVGGRVFAGNRDGYMYAIGAQGSPNQGQLLWKYKTGGPIHLSAAYKDGVIFFAADDNYAYALRVATGALVWKSAKLPGDGYHSYWPVIYRDKVVFTAALSYRHELEPGMMNVEDVSGSPYGNYAYMEKEDLFPGEPTGSVLGPLVSGQDWAHGLPVIDASRVTEYTENNPNPTAFTHKPWRRLYIVLNVSNGTEYTFDSDGDGFGEYMPFVSWGTKSGNRYPPIVGPDDILYASNLYMKTGDAQGKVMGWKLGTPYLSLVGGQAAVVEPQAISIGGSTIYRNLCCDRSASFFGIYAQSNTSLWSYDLDEQAPGYDSMWTIIPGWPRLEGWYKGDSDSINGIYHNHGDQNPVIPYDGRLYAHRSNAIIVYGTGTPLGQLPLLRINRVNRSSKLLSKAQVTNLLENEVQKMVDAGHLRPGYYNSGQFSIYKEIADYFNNPGDTLYTLSIAYPYLSSDLQAETRAYLQREFADYFDPVMYSSIGWAEGAAREAMPLPPEIEQALVNYPKRQAQGGFSWFYPQQNFYAMWKYAQIFPNDAARVYELAKTKVQIPLPQMPVVDYFEQKPYELNAYIAGYFGFLELQELAGKSTVDSQLRSQVTQELNRLLLYRVNTFSKDTCWTDDYYHRRALNIARNFMMLVPELGDYFHQNALPQMQEALDEYEYVAPYWFVARYESMIDEGTMSPLYNYAAMFSAKAYILHEPASELLKYLDTPAFDRGDLFYIQNLVAVLQAQW